MGETGATANAVAPVPSFAVKTAPFTAALIPYVLLSYLTLVLEPQAIYVLAVSELGYFQLVGALAFLVAGVLFALAYRRARRWSFAVLAAVFVFGAGEELSWGQHLLAIESPERIKDLNAQDELTVHNLNFFERRGLSFDLAFLAFGATLAVGAPLASRLSRRARRLLTGLTPSVPPVLTLAFVLTYLVAKLAESLSPWHHATAEIRESNFAVVFAAIAFSTLREATRAHGRQPPRTTTGTTIRVSRARPSGRLGDRGETQTERLTRHDSSQAR